MGYHCFPHFLARTPFFSFKDITCYDKIMHEPVFREMLQIATPDLSGSMNKDEDKDKDKASLSAYRYYQRACTRSTPFGLFAGCSVGTIGDRTEIQLSEQQKYKRITRLDMNYICMLIQKIERDRVIRKQLCYYPNSSLYLVGDHLRYVEYHYQKTRRIHQTVQVEISEYLQKVIDLARKGARFTELSEALTDNEITNEEAEAFIHDLIDSQVLISELEPAVTNVQPLTVLISKLNGLPNINRQVTFILSEIESQLLAIDQQPIGQTGDIYPEIIRNIEKTKVETEIKYLFQTDMFKPSQHATVSRHIMKDIQYALTFLNKISLPVLQTNISQFRENFVKRFGEREMPMLYVSDNELGIGYTGNTSGDISPLVDDLAVPREYKPFNIQMSTFQSILLQKYQQTLQKGERIIELTDEDVKEVDAVWNDLPLTFSVKCQILQDDNQGRSIHIQSAGGSSAANLLGRFCHLDEQILNHTLTITEKEAQLNPDVIFAEITHLPESRIGNILLCPVLRPYEISYLAKAGVSDQFELRPDDLYISVRNNRIRLRSKRLNKEIIPRMSTAHNYSGQHPMPVYHFLCDLQHQDGRHGFGFNWNEAAKQFDYLPRVVYKNCILLRARWTVHGKDIKTFAEIKDDGRFRQKIKEWQEGRNIPDSVVLVDGDNELYIDFNNILSVRAWLSIVKKRQTFYVEEFLFNTKTAVVQGPEGAFTNEFMFAFYRT